MSDDPERPGRNDPPPPVRDPFGADGASPPFDRPLDRSLAHQTADAEAQFGVRLRRDAEVALPGLGPQVASRKLAVGARPL